MALDQELSFSETGEATVTDLATVESPSAPATEETPKEVGIKRIMQLVADPDAALADISGLIALEIATVVGMMGQDDPLHRNNRSMRDLNDHVKALRELQKTLTERDASSKKDTLNLDGPKFQYVFKAIMDLFGESLKSAGLDEALSKNVMLQFRDLIQKNDDRIRRDINKIEMGR